MYEFTSHPDGIEGVLSDLPRELLCRVDGEDVTIPKQFPAMVGLAYASLKDRYGSGAALVWAMQVSLGSAMWDKLLNVGLLDDQLTLLTSVVVDRIQGGEAPVPQAPGPEAPKARAPRKPRTGSARK